jgi:hypothetical protein
MPAFFSDNGKLTLPVVPHSQDGKYTPIEVGKPLCVEILHIAFGNVKDWWGKADILVSSWAKTGVTAKPGARLVNLIRGNIPQFQHISDLGAAEYGHQLVYYTPAYDGTTVRFSLEFLEIDKLNGNEIATLGNALKGLSALPIFAPQLSFLVLAPEILEIGKKLYNIFNRNDVVLLEHLDLSFNEPDSNVLTSGRYVLVNGSQNALTFAEKFRLEPDNMLHTQAGDLAEEVGLKDAYIVIRINSVEKDEYKDFEVDSAAQEILDAVANQGVTTSIAELLTDSVKAAKQFGSVEKVLGLKKRLDAELDKDKKDEWKKAIESELRLLTEDQAALLKEVLGLLVRSVPGR